MERWSTIQKKESRSTFKSHLLHHGLVIELLYLYLQVVFVVSSGQTLADQTSKNSHEQLLYQVFG